ncbi:MAG TPA: antitoxin Xre/MbcA/ParS toxin-binding domain-containing protein [Rhizomicrobium sp.]|jgi:putative toxin-antitoxin system antitoxin component (TIGR02293 family)
MPDVASAGAVEEAEDLARVQKLFGGRQMLGRTVKTQFEAHELLNDGLKAKALDYLVRKKIVHVPQEDVFKAIGISERTYQRQRKLPERSLNSDQSGRAWKFAEMLSEATSIFGSQTEAERWLERPALGLNRQRPIDLLTTSAGRRLVATFLTRLKYGVYT